MSFREGICLYLLILWKPILIFVLKMEWFFGKWDSNDLYNVQRWFPTSYADLYLFIPCLYG